MSYSKTAKRPFVTAKMPDHNNKCLTITKMPNKHNKSLVVKKMSGSKSKMPDYFTSNS